MDQDLKDLETREDQEREEKRDGLAEYVFELSVLMNRVAIEQLKNPEGLDHA